MIPKNVQMPNPNPKYKPPGTAGGGRGGNAMKYDNCKDCVARCVHAGKDREFICGNGVSCKVTKKPIATNAEVQTMRWIPVEERLPEEKQRVIVRCERVGTSVGWILWGRWMTDIGPHAGDVTHWMPLPEPPDSRPPEGET